MFKDITVSVIKVISFFSIIYIEINSIFIAPIHNNSHIKMLYIVR